MTSYALRRDRKGDIDDFPRDVLELIRYFREPEPGQQVVAVPGAGLHVPIWILGSSLFGAQLAAALGLPYAFASHFAPAALDQALEIYRERFEPSEQLSKPYVMLGFNVCAADTDDEARFLRTSGLQAILRLRRGQPGKLPPPTENFDDQLSPADHAMMKDFSSCSAVGTVETVQDGLRQFVARTGADEIIVSSQIYSHEARVRSYELLAEAGRSLDDAAAELAVASTES